MAIEYVNQIISLLTHFPTWIYISAFEVHTELRFMGAWHSVKGVHMWFSMQPCKSHNNSAELNIQKGVSHTTF